LPRVGPVLQCRSDRVSDLACLSTRFPARLLLQYLRDRPAPFISPASARDSQQGWYCSTSGIGPLPSSRLPQHEIPSKDGTAVPPGTARSLRGRSDSAVRFMARVAGLIPGQPGRPVSALFPAWHLRDRPAPFGDGAIRPSDSWQGSSDSSRDSRVGRYRHFSRHGTSGIGPLPSGTERSGRPIHGKGRRTHPGTAGSAGIGTFPGMVPPGSARSLRGQSLSVIRFCGRGRLTQPASARDSQQGWYCSTSGIGPSRANQTCLSTGNLVDVA
jgi:hypothetical protein